MFHMAILEQWWTIKQFLSGNDIDRHRATWTARWHWVPLTCPLFLYPTWGKLLSFFRSLAQIRCIKGFCLTYNILITHSSHYCYSSYDIVHISDLPGFQFPPVVPLKLLIPPFTSKSIQVVLQIMIINMITLSTDGYTSTAASVFCRTTSALLPSSARDCKRIVLVASCTSVLLL